MATTLPISLGYPLALEAVSGDTPIQYHASDLRQLIGATFPRYGRLGLGDALWLYPRAAGANWSVDVQAGWFVSAPPINPSYAAERYLLTVPTRTNIPLDGAAPYGFNLAPSSPRTHKVWIQWNDKNLTGTTYGASLVVTEDTGSGAPNPTGTGYGLIGTVTISPSQSNISAANLSTTLGRASTATLPVAVTYLNSMIAGDGAGGPGVTYSVNGNTVRLQGNIKPTGSGAYAAGGVYTVCNVALGYRPAYARVLLAASSGPTLARVIVNTTGDITVTPFASNGSNMSYVCFDGLNYEIF